MIHFATNKIIHLPRKYYRSAKYYRSSKYTKGFNCQIRWYTEKEYHLRVLRKRPNILREYLRWPEKERILYASCIIIEEEGGMYWDASVYKPFKKIKELVAMHKLIGIRNSDGDGGGVLFICGPPVDYIYEKIQEDTITWVDSDTYGKTRKIKKINMDLLFVVLYLIFTIVGFICILTTKVLLG